MIALAYILFALCLLIAAYYIAVEIAMTAPVEVVYYAWLSPLLRSLLPAGFVCISLWRKAVMLYPPTHALGTLTPQGRIHELEGHIFNPNQWAGHPHAFPWLYLRETLTCGYGANKYEEQARRIAGQPSRA